MKARKIVRCGVFVALTIMLILRCTYGQVGEAGGRASGGLLVDIRDEFAQTIVQHIPGEREGALGVAYLLGMKEGLDKRTEELLRYAGLTHLVVASGTHLGILTEFVKKGCGRASRFSGAFFSILFVILFGEMIGWTASITRAAIVSIIGTLGWYFGVETDPWKVILFAVEVTLMINPAYLFDLGWELSFLAFFGIMIVAPRFEKILYPKEKGDEIKPRRASGITKSVLSSVAVTICVAPVLIYNFGYFSLASIVGNLIIAPTLAEVMGLTFLAGIPGVVGEGCGQIVGVILKIHLKIIKFFGEKAYFLVEINAKDARIFLLYLPLVMFILIYEIMYRRKVRRVAEKIRAKPEKHLRWKKLDYKQN